MSKYSKQRKKFIPIDEIALHGTDKNETLAFFVSYLVSKKIAACMNILLLLRMASVNLRNFL